MSSQGTKRSLKLTANDKQRSFKQQPADSNNSISNDKEEDLEFDQLNKSKTQAKKDKPKSKAPMRTPAEQLNEMRDRISKLELVSEKHLKDFEQVRSLSFKTNNEIIKFKL